MKSVRNYLIKSKLTFVVATMILFSCGSSPSFAEVQEPDNVSSSKKKIKLALLLDTSGSMDGLINQAKSQLWSLVNELAKAECDGEVPSLEIALYEYGNDGLPARENYIRMVTPLTHDLDKLSQDLFSLKTNGGSEFCGAVINQALKELDWSKDSTDLQVIFIAGNEPFTQGNVPYFEACQKANELGVIVNTIHCGDFDEGIRTQWKHGAQITNGSYMSIDHNKVSKEIDTPFDDDIVRLNSELNKTYVSYGSKGKMKFENQAVQDNNAYKMDKKAFMQRSVSKSNNHYKSGAAEWDIVSKVQLDSSSLDMIEEIDEEQLPSAMKEMNVEERKSYVIEKSKERVKIEKEIATLNVKREKYITENTKEEEDSGLGNALIEAIHQQAKTKSIEIK